MFRWRLLRSFLLLVGAGTGCPSVHAQERVTLSGRELVVWRPPVSPGVRSPVLIFSHGFGGCATQSTFLTEALARHGYWVFAPNHRDARCGGRRAHTPPETPFRNPERWTEKSYQDRADDIRAVQRALADSRQFGARLDFSRLGYLGHSLGGYTVLGLAGAWPSWKDSTVKAVLALSPYAQPFITQRTLSGLSVPVMYQGGTLDFGITPWLRKTEGAYEASPPPKYFVSFSGAGHMAWTDLRDDAHRLIVEYAVAFLDRYVRGVPTGDVLTRAIPGVAEFRFESELGAPNRRSAVRRGA
jgi:predicted dienelactone hydrolase